MQRTNEQRNERYPVKRKLLFQRTLQMILDITRLVAMVAFGACGLYSLFGQLSLFGLENRTVIIFIVLVFLCYVSKYPLNAWKRRIDFLINNFEDTAAYARRKTKFGEYDEDGDLNIGLMLKRGSDDAIKDLNALIGLEDVKEEVMRMESVFNFESQQNKNTDTVARHLAFCGNPGCGKTEVASIFSGLLYKYGRIKHNMYLQCTGNDLTGEFSGQTKAKVNAIFKRCRGGVLFIDEAYILGQGNDALAAEAVAQLLVHMESEKDTVIIFAGYTEEMKRFMAINPGLASRIGTAIDFPDYTAHELLLITKKFMDKKDVRFTEDAEKVLTDIYQEKINMQEPNFSNGRYARNCFNEIYQQHAVLFQHGKSPIKDANAISVADIVSIRDRLLSQT